MGYFRHPRTTQERRASQDGYGRPARNLKNLPNSWDDIWAETSRCWKQYRKTQYKVKNIDSDHIIGYGTGENTDGI
jgi:hypothetical protein